MDFLLLVPGGGRIVLEVDGQTHYAINGRVDPATYARTMTGSRNLTLAGYEVHRFGAHDLRDVVPEYTSASVGVAGKDAGSAAPSLQAGYAVS